MGKDLEATGRAASGLSSGYVLRALRTGHKMRSMRRSVVLTTPYPTPEETARVYRIPKREAARIQRLVEESLAKKGYFEKNGADSTNGNGSKKGSSTAGGRRRVKARSASRRKPTRGKAKSAH